ncbi:unnamed protein product, partial [Rotaria magnacalcarata]
TSSTSTSTSTTTTTTTTTSSTSSSTSTTSVSTTTTTSATTATTSTTTSQTTTSVTTVTTTTSTTTTTTAPYCTTRVTFDDIPGQLATTGVVPNGYHNLNWANVWYVNASTEPTSGYQYDVTSPPFVGTNPGGATVEITSANGTSFAFDSMVVTSAWRDNLYWVIYGYRNGVNTVAGGFYMQVMNQTTISCGTCTNLDTLYFVVSGGTPHLGLAQTGYEFAFDDLCISFGY